MGWNNLWIRILLVVGALYKKEDQLGWGEMELPQFWKLSFVQLKYHSFLKSVTEGSQLWQVGSNPCDLFYWDICCHCKNKTYYKTGEQTLPVIIRQTGPNASSLWCPDILFSGWCPATQCRIVFSRLYPDGKWKRSNSTVSGLTLMDVKGWLLY